ncbi:uncharacterized protein LOC134181269 [Corticium candelabrum]|uniref:uncharacterized protein LOC134181269 n=1 Tax=Corticium candelabrum TaxID=121492 RepID=UPI002E254E1E|nr:uncharacterized protein LOC134181269 [Corticium candelabrum]XP_062504498.1 uncharacterized protein LOC134181269 [Corticium candelabrum]
MIVYKECVDIEEANMRDTSKVLCSVLHYLAAAQLSAGEFGDAIKSYKKIVKLYQQEEDPPYSLIANACMKLGRVCHHVGRFADAAEHFEQSLNVREQKQLTSETTSKSEILQLLAEAQVDAKNFDKAIECYKKLVELHQREDPPSYLAIADTLLRLGQLCYRTSNFDDGLEHFEKSLRIRKQKQLLSQPTTGEVYQYLGMTHWSMLHKDRAEKFMISAEMPHVDKALSAYTKSVNVFLSCPGYERQALENLEQLANLYGITITSTATNDKATMIRLVARTAYARRDFTRAKDLLCIEKKVRFGATTSHPVQKAIVLHDIGLCEMRLSQLDRAEKTFTETLKIVQSLRPREHEDLQMLYIKNLVGLVRFLKYYQQSVH